MGGGGGQHLKYKLDVWNPGLFLEDDSGEEGDHREYSCTVIV